ncbi:S41 family peptidase, partial [Patescibacteria group bacterium]|nr:S41 family peptidase [Patescibacteria group bacterium]
TSLQEFVRVMDKANKGEQLDGLIFDLRDNIGGAIDNLPYFLGPFIGPDQYAYQFYHQGEKEDFKTRSGWINSLARYKKVVILINEQSQSSAELMASVLKKYNVGVLMGNTSKGWGTIEKVFPIENQIDDKETYSIFLVHRVTLREDGQAIEGQGVEPLISFDDKNWKRELLKYFEDPLMVEAVEKVK